MLAMVLTLPLLLYRQTQSRVWQWFGGEVETGKIEYGSCLQASLSPIPPAVLPLSRECESASPSLGPQLPVHKPYTTGHDIGTWEIHVYRWRNWITIEIRTAPSP